MKQKVEPQPGHSSAAMVEWRCMRRDAAFGTGLRNAKAGASRPRPVGLDSRHRLSRGAEERIEARLDGDVDAARQGGAPDLGRLLKRDLALLAEGIAGVAAGPKRGGAGRR